MLIEKSEQHIRSLGKESAPAARDTPAGKALQKSQKTLVIVISKTSKTYSKLTSSYRCFVHILDTFICTLYPHGNSTFNTWNQCILYKYMYRPKQRIKNYRFKALFWGYWNLIRATKKFVLLALLATMKIHLISTPGITFSIVISVIQLSKGLGCVIISVHDNNDIPFVSPFDDKVGSLSEFTDGVPFSTGEVAGTSTCSRRFPVNLRVDCVDIHCSCQGLHPYS